MKRKPFVLLVLFACTVAGTAASQPRKDAWWQHAVVYEIYLRSFQDSNADGVGDLAGITQRLDYLKALGIDAIWISPMYPSPLVDFGYDISDYDGIDPQYGTMADFDQLLAQAKKRGIRIILDFVMNHTSDQHPWFIAAAASRTDPKHDWYVWSDGIHGDGGARLPPNNWRSLFGGSAWEWRGALGQFYYHAFYKQQPDLNWRNPAVELAMFDAMRFWLNRGVAGFRLDAVTALFEDVQLRDEPLLEPSAGNHRKLRHIYTDDLPEVHDIMRRMRAMISAYPGDRVLIGETYVSDAHKLDEWYGGERHDELQLPMDLSIGFIDKLDVALFRQRLTQAYTQIHGSQPLLAFDNHDHRRSWDRYGDGHHDEKIAKLIATLLLTSKATVLLYQGEEIGQRTAPSEPASSVKDAMGRDGERTPMQWNAANRQAGFSTNPSTWLPVPAGYARINVATELADSKSLLNWHRRLIALRRERPALRDGRIVMLDTQNPDVLSYARITGARAILVALNMSAQPRTTLLDLKAAGIGGSALKTLMLNDERPSLHASSRGTETSVRLPAYAAWVADVR